LEAEPFSFATYQPPRKFQHRYWLHALLFLLTVGSTTCVGVERYVGFQFAKGVITLADLRSAEPWFFLAWPWIVAGLTYSLPLLAILGAHEFGHYWYCRKHDVDASLPYFLPAPVPLTGTVGAVIRIKEAFPSKKALFDIGVSGPIAGFVVMVPFLVWGVMHSAKVSFAPTDDVFYFGEPLLLKAIAWWHFGTLPKGVDITLHPVGFAAWFGMLATAMNLLPFGQLDGGHIAYSVFGPRARFVSMATLGVTVILVVVSFSWISMAVIMMAMAWFLGFRHPAIIDEHEPLDSRRRMVAVLALVIFVLCFTPVPIETFLGK
jgi:membrane-associated protease RseP (regulator of RpoE activity)